MRILAIDPGTKRVGLAISDPSETIATALDTVPAEPSATLVSRLSAIVSGHEVERVVMGLPRRLDGSEGPEAAASRDLAARLRLATGRRVDLEDERMTTAQAEKHLIAGGMKRARRRTTIDGVAAAILLQGFLDRHRAR